MLLLSASGLLLVLVGWSALPQLLVLLDGCAAVGAGSAGSTQACSLHSCGQCEGQQGL